MKHKLICWGDYSIPVPLCAKWLAFDANGDACYYKHKPELRRDYWKGAAYDGWNIFIEGGMEIEPPESGPWAEQLYWIG